MLIQYWRMYWNGRAESMRKTQTVKFGRETSLEVLIQKTSVPMGDNININVARKDQSDMNWTEVI
jgi:hypothetical protein